jgi:hypothetical protein
VIGFHAGRYVVAWEKRDAFPGDAIWGAVINENGSIRVAAKKLTFGGNFSRGAELVPLGDRLLLIWAEYDGAHYQLFKQVLSSELSVIGKAERLTSGAADSLEPSAAIGQNGPGREIGILYERRSERGWQVYFQRLICRLGE